MCSESPKIVWQEVSSWNAFRQLRSGWRPRRSMVEACPRAVMATAGPGAQLGRSGRPYQVREWRGSVTCAGSADGGRATQKTGLRRWMASFQLGWSRKWRSGGGGVESSWPGRPPIASAACPRWLAAPQGLSRPAALQTHNFCMRPSPSFCICGTGIRALRIIRQPFVFRLSAVSPSAIRARRVNIPPGCWKIAPAATGPRRLPAKANNSDQARAEILRQNPSYYMNGPIQHS